MVIHVEVVTNFGFINEFILCYPIIKMSLDVNHWTLPNLEGL